MPTYRVRWEIDIEADSPREAAARALIVQRDSDPANTATVFDVTPHPDATGMEFVTITVDVSPEASPGLPDQD